MHRCRTLKADNYSITQFGEITPYLIMNPALEFQNPSVYSKSGVTTNMKTAVNHARYINRLLALVGVTQQSISSTAGRKSA
jgi:ABC-type uncharacterized transport system ATPase subunit